MDFFEKHKKQFVYLLLTLGIYSYFGNFYTAFILVATIGFHEYSHLFAAKLLGLRTRGFYLIPFLGGISLIDDKYKSAKQQAIVAIAGPIGGALLATLLVLSSLATKNIYASYAAFIMFSINLFNMIPFSFLDGGQILDTIVFSINEKLGVYWKVVSAVAGIFLCWELNPTIAIIIMVIGLPPAVINLWNLKSFKFKLTKLSSKDIVIITTVYLSVVTYLLFMTLYTYNISDNKSETTRSTINITLPI